MMPMRRKRDLIIPGCLIMFLAWLIAGASLVAGVWVGLDIALGGEIAKGVGIGLGFLVGGQLLAVIVWFIGFAISE